MNPYVTLLERCGYIVKYYDGWHVWKPGEEDQPISFGVDDDVKTCALEVGAKEAADWMEQNVENLFVATTGNHEWVLDMNLDDEVDGAFLVSNLDLIRIATKAGWEKGDGL